MIGSGESYCDGLRQFLLELRRRLPNTDPRDVEGINKIYANISATERELSRRCGGVTPGPSAPLAPPDTGMDGDDYCSRLRTQIYNLEQSAEYGNGNMERARKLREKFASECGGIGTSQPQPAPRPAPPAPKPVGAGDALPRNQPWKPKMLSQGAASPIAPPVYSGPAGPRKQRPFGGAGFKPY